jgi:gluconokinase
MHRGIPLIDADRMPWLGAIHDKLVQAQAEHRNLVLGCSALKQAYREKLFQGSDLRLVYLKGDYGFIAQRLRARRGHFADEHILAAQFADLEEPSDALVVEIHGEPEQIVDEICRRLNLQCAV